MAARLSRAERQAVEDLKALASRWPKTLGLFSDGTLYVMKLGPDGQFVTKTGGRGARMDQSYIVARIDGIKTDGGDAW